MYEKFGETKYSQENFDTEDKLVNFIVDHFETELYILAVVSESVKNKVLDGLLNNEYPYHHITIRDQENENDLYFITKLKDGNDTRIVVEPARNEDGLMKTSEGDKIVLIMMDNSLNEEDITSFLSETNEEVVFMVYSKDYLVNEKLNEELNQDKSEIQKLFDKAKIQEFEVDDLDDTENISEIKKEKEKDILKTKKINDKLEDRESLEIILDSLIKCKTLEQQLYLIQDILHTAYVQGYKSSLINMISTSEDLLDIIEDEEENK